MSASDLGDGPPGFAESYERSLPRGTRRRTARYMARTSQRSRFLSLFTQQKDRVYWGRRLYAVWPGFGHDTEFQVVLNEIDDDYFFLFCAPATHWTCVENRKNGAVLEKFLMDCQDEFV